MNLIKYELKKIFNNKFLIICVSILILLSAFLSIKDITNQMIAKDELINNFLIDYNKNKTEVKTYISDYISSYEEVLKIRRETNDNSIPFPESKYVKNQLVDYASDYYFFKEIIKSVESYSSNYTATIKNAIKISKSRIAEYEYKISKDPTLSYSFEIEYQKGVLNSYNSIQDIELSMVPIAGYNYLLFNNGYGIISMICALIGGMVLILPEKQYGMYSILRSTKNGRGKTFFAKIITAFVFCLITCFLITLVAIVSIGIKTGYMGGNELIQNLVSPFSETNESYRLCPFLITINQGVLLSFVLRLFSCLTFLLIIIILSSIFNNYIPSFILGILFIGTNYVIGNYNFLNEYDFFKNLNFFESINGVKPLIVYRAIKIFNIALPQIESIIVTYTILIIVAIITSFFLFIRGKSISFKRIEKIKLKIFNNSHNVTKIKTHKIKHLLGYELKKIFSLVSILIITIGLVLSVVSSYNYYSKPLTSEEIKYISNIQLFEGEWTYEKHVQIKNTLDSYYEILNSYQKLQNAHLAGAISNEEYLQALNLYMVAKSDLQVVENLYKHSESLKTIAENGGSAYFINENGWHTYHIFNNSYIFIIILILIFSNIFALEYKNGFNLILNSTISRNKVIKQKILITIIFSIILVTICELVQILFILRYRGLSYPLASIANFTYLQTKSNMSILLFYSIQFLKELFITICFSLFILFLSRITKKLFSTLIISSVVSFTPMLFEYFGFTFMNNFSLIKLLGRM